MKEKKLKVAIVQDSPVLFNLQQTIDKSLSLINEASKQNPNLIVFPEAFIPAYPRGLNFGAPVGSRSPEGRDLFYRYWDNSIEIPSEEINILGEAAKKANSYLCMGIIEKDSTNSKGTLYCTIVYFDPNGKYVGKHRKIKPTAAERVIWGEGDSSTLTVVDTPFGKLGGLICWENYMPLARMAMYSKGIDIYITPTADDRDSWQATLKHIALEGRCFVLNCNQFVTKNMYPDYLLDEIQEHTEIMSRGGSAIYSPLGETIAEPLFNEKGIIYADLDLTEIPKARFDFDVVGHYNRPDLFDFKIK